VAERFRRHADALVRHRRSPLCAELMYGAAADLDAGGVVARLFAGVPVPPGSVPQLRLLAALHHLVLAGRAPALSRFYPSAGGRLAPGGAWPVARQACEQHFGWIRSRLPLTVQTNEPGRACVLFAALVWLTDRYGLPIRLLEIGASAGLNLLADRYCYVVGGEAIGDTDSPVRFAEPWRPGPRVDVRACARRLTIHARAGCDLRPLNPRRPEHRLALMSYIWPDELERIERMRSALKLAAIAPPPVAAERAGAWLRRELAGGGERTLTVVWQSLFRQYVGADEWQAISDAVGHARQPAAAAPIVWLRMEPSDDHLAGVGLVARVSPDERDFRLAVCGDHGPPVIWREDS